jgi:hypothetical protein
MVHRKKAGGRRQEAEVKNSLLITHYSLLPYTLNP